MKSKEVDIKSAEHLRDVLYSMFTYYIDYVKELQAEKEENEKVFNNIVKKERKQREEKTVFLSYEAIVKAYRKYKSISRKTKKRITPYDLEAATDISCGVFYKIKNNQPVRETTGTIIAAKLRAKYSDFVATGEQGDFFE